VSTAASSAATRSIDGGRPLMGGVVALLFDIILSISI
jgi:hypothetical protein